MVLDLPSKRFAMQQLHRQESEVDVLGPLLEAILFLMVPDIEDSADIWVRYFSGELDLADESLSCAPVRGNFRQDSLQRNVFVESRVVRLVDLAHTAAPNEANDLVTASNYLVRSKPR
jgi:hypothetical protein